MFSAEFTDYDAYAQAIERVDARFIMQNLEQRLWQIDGLALPSGTTVQHCLSGSGAIARGVAPGGGVELAIPAAGHFIANGESVPLTGALLLGNRPEFMVSIPGRHRWFNVFVPDPQAQALGLPVGADGLPAAANGILRNRHPAAYTVSSLLVKFVSCAREVPAIAASPASLESFQADLLAALGAAYGNQAPATPDPRGRPPLIDKGAILRAVDAIESSRTPTVPAAELADVAQLSQRSLRAGFRKYLGLSPTDYMQLRNLNRARQQLSASLPGETTVARVATDLGIWDLGRFATRYRRLFGEPPSATLRRT